MSLQQFYIEIGNDIPVFQNQGNIFLYGTFVTKMLLHRLFIFQVIYVDKSIKYSTV